MMLGPDEETVYGFVLYNPVTQRSMGLPACDEFLSPSVREVLVEEAVAMGLRVTVKETTTVLTTFAPDKEKDR